MQGAETKSKPINEAKLKKEEEELYDGESLLLFLNVDIKKTNDQRLVLKKYPCTQWGIGVVIVLIGLFTLYYLLVGSQDPNGFLFLKYHPTSKFKWWHYVLNICIIGLGILFLYSGK